MVTLRKVMLKINIKPGRNNQDMRFAHINCLWIKDRKKLYPRRITSKWGTKFVLQSSGPSTGKLVSDRRLLFLGENPQGEFRLINPIYIKTSKYYFITV